MTERRRFTRVDDPDLSPEANRVLTQELRDALGPGARTDETIERVPQPRSFADAFGANSTLIAVTFGALVVIGAIVSLVTGSWWAVVLAAAVHAVATVTVLFVTLRMSMQVEHMDPASAERLQEEGISDPDATLGELVHRHAELRTPPGNRVSGEAGADPARAEVEQRGAMTPAGGPVEPSSAGGPPGLLVAVAVGASLLVGIVVAAVTGGAAWLGVVLLLGSALAWAALWRWTPGDAHPGPSASHSRRLLPATAILVAVAVIAGVIIVGAVAGYL
jgi:hypothetical protein